MAEQGIEGEIVTYTNTGKIFIFSIIILSSIVSDHPFIHKRRQFSKIVYYAMTINKSQ